MATAMTLTVAIPGTKNLPEGKKSKLDTNKECAILRVRLDETFLPKEHSYTVLAEKCLALARDLNGIALTMTFPWEGNSKYKQGDLLVLKRIYSL